MFRSRLFAVACLLAVPSVVACVNDAQVEETGESEDGLRALSSSEILGDIAFNTSVNASHSGTPKYRAYSFTVAQGDKLDIWVRSTNADARAWLLDDGFRTVKWNNDASGNDAEDEGTTDANIKHTVTRAGKYYVAFRGAVGVAATFSVQVDRVTTQQPPPIDPPQPGNPWGCGGTPLSNAELVARIPTGSDTLSFLPASGLRYETRQRTCNQQTGCGAWSSPSAVTGNDGAFSKLAISTTSGGAVTLSVASASDSNHTYTINAGQVTSTSHHAPNHENGSYEASLTSTCFGSRIKLTQGTNGQGTWTEIEYGAKTSMPGTTSRPPADDSNPWECGGAPLSQADILRRFASGTDTLDALIGGTGRIDVRTRNCSAHTGCAPWSSLSPVSGNDGALSTLKVQTTSSNGLTLQIASASDSNHTYNVASGTFSSTAHHAPNHENGAMAGSITNGCLGYRIQTKTGQSGTGTWTETQFGYKGGFPAPIR
jgi:hypothetical protein